MNYLSHGRLSDFPNQMIDAQMRKIALTMDMWLKYSGYSIPTAMKSNSRLQALVLQWNKILEYNGYLPLEVPK